MRIIDADALIEWIDENVSENTPYALVTKAVVISALKSKNVAPTVGGWISVTDRMPEDETVVIIFVQHKIGWYRAFAWHDAYGWHSSADEFSDGESDFVTHWMPLLEPPEVKNE